MDLELYRPFDAVQDYYVHKPPSQRTQQAATAASLTCQR
jgi:hypothetical protein